MPRVLTFIPGFADEKLKFSEREGTASQVASYFQHNVQPLRPDRLEHNILECD